MRGKCATCQFYDSDDGAETGDCHAHPPQVAITIDGKSKAYWPLVTPESWCGEFRQAIEITPSVDVDLEKLFQTAMEKGQ